MLKPYALNEASELFMFFGPRLLFAAICGGLIGLERELRSKAAGIKTNILICVGAALYTSVSILISSTLAENGHFGDPARIAAQIVSGIGFLGGGAIIQSRGHVHGLTTAATIWVVAAIGILVGLGFPWVALCATLLVILLLVAMRFLEARFIDHQIAHSCKLVLNDPEGQMRGLLGTLLSRHELRVDTFEFAERKDKDEVLVSIRYHGTLESHNRFIMSVSNYSQVKEVRHK